MSEMIKVSKKCQKSVTKDFVIFPGGNGNVRLASMSELYPVISISYTAVFKLDREYSPLFLR